MLRDPLELPPVCLTTVCLGLVRMCASAQRGIPGSGPMICRLYSWGTQIDEISSADGGTGTSHGMRTLGSHPTLHRGLALRHRVVEVHPARRGDPARGLRQRRVLLHEIEDRLPAVHLPWLGVDIDDQHARQRADRRDDARAAVELPPRLDLFRVPAADCPSLGLQSLGRRARRFWGRSARDGVLGACWGIQMETVMWPKSGQLDWWERTMQDRRGRVRRGKKRKPAR